MKQRERDVLIVGAGLAGLMAGRELRDAGHDVLIVDKGSSVGGRLATLRLGRGAADHGAQYFTAQTEEFQRQVDEWEAEGAVFLWSLGFGTASLSPNRPSGRTQYAARGGMRALAEHLAQGLNVELNAEIASVSWTEESWRAETEDGTIYRARALLLTPPVPQALALLDAGGVTLSEHDRAALASIRYIPCIVGIFRYKGEVNLPKPGAVQRPASPISFIADNQQKGISPDEPILTLEANAEYSNRYWDAPEVEILETMKAHLEAYVPETTRLQEAQIKRWRYSTPISFYPERVLQAETPPALFFAGDAFGSPGVEGAYLSGRAAGRAIHEQLAHPNIS